MIPYIHQETIRALTKANPEVMQATCDIPHLSPNVYLRRSCRVDDTPLPYCGCFVGVYNWMLSSQHKRSLNLHATPIYNISTQTRVDFLSIHHLAIWCATRKADEEAVEYALECLECLADLSVFS